MAILDALELIQCVTWGQIPGWAGSYFLYETSMQKQVAIMTKKSLEK